MVTGNWPIIMLQETRQGSTSELSSIQKQIEAAKNSENEMHVKVKEIEQKIVQLEKKRDKVRIGWMIVKCHL